MKTKKTIKTIFSSLLIIVLLLAVAYIVMQRTGSISPAAAPEEVPEEANATVDAYVDTLKSRLYSSQTPESENGESILQLLKDNSRCEAVTEPVDRTHAQAMLTLYGLDSEALAAELGEIMNALAAEYVENAEPTEKIYTDELQYLPEISEKLFSQALLQCRGASCEAQTFTVSLEYADKQWTVSDDSSPKEINADELSRSLYEKCTALLEYVPRHYSLAWDAVCGNTPREECFGVTADPAEVRALLETPIAKQLIGDRETVWNEDIQLISGGEINYYLDESILVIVWQEELEGSVGTYSEIFLGDASQIRRKIADDTVCSLNFNRATYFAKQAKAVLAVGGDYYLHSQINGIMVYQGELYKYRPEICDTCYFDSNGDMTVVPVAEAGTEEEVLQYVKDNNIMFSLCWGPAIIRDSQDITPASYAYGEINDCYARSCIGQLGKLHYLTMNANCEQPTYYKLITLKTAAQAMLDKGCYTAYTLDGGQTACTIMNGQLINTVQFGYERLVGDIIYFATAMPEEE